jgi:hypothetical protein
MLLSNSKVNLFTTKKQKTITFTKEEIAELEKQQYLGKRAEIFMLAYLMRQDKYSNIHHSIQIQDEKTTLGEIDFLFFDESLKKWIHLELVTKFYVYNSDEEVENYTHWIGPNLKDKLEYKLDKLKQQQLHILERPEARKKLSDLGINADDVETQLCYKAKLFIPMAFEDFFEKTTSSKCLYGFYFSLEDFKKLKFLDYLYYVPQKLDWVCSPRLNTHWYTYDKALAIIKDSLKEKRSCMLWRKTPEGHFLQDFVVWWS